MKLRFRAQAMKYVFLFAVIMLSLLSFTFAVTKDAAGQAAAEILPTDKIIPTHFKTYSLFLVCNPLWLAPDKSQGLDDLYRQFKDFGRTIGDDNLAVWFWKSRSVETDRALAQNEDVERSVRLCEAWKLKPSAGPHLVVTSTYPDESHLTSGLAGNRAVYALGNMKPTDIAS